MASNCIRFKKSSRISIYQTVAVPSVTKYALILRNVTTYACGHIQMLVSPSSRDCVCQLVSNITYLQFPLEISSKANKHNVMEDSILFRQTISLFLSGCMRTMFILIFW